MFEYVFKNVFDLFAEFVTEKCADNVAENLVVHENVSDFEFKMCTKMCPFLSSKCGVRVCTYFVPVYRNEYQDKRTVYSYCEHDDDGEEDKAWVKRTKHAEPIDSSQVLQGTHLRE